MSEKIYQPETLPVLALRNLVIFPEQTVSFEVGRLKSIRAIKSAVDTTDKKIFLVSQQDALLEDPKFTDLSAVGVVAEIKQITGSPENGGFEIVVEGLYRASVCEVLREKVSLRAVIKRVEEFIPVDEDIRTTAVLRAVKKNFDRYLAVSPRVAPEIFLSILEDENLRNVVDDIAGHFHFPVKDKQSLLDELDVMTRAEKLCKILSREAQVLELELEIQDKVQSRMDKNQREYYLREQIKTASLELGDDDSPVAEAEKYKAKIETLPIDDKTKKKLFEECDRLVKTSPGSPEANVSRTYLDRVTNLPWGI